jgi:hypothetical protein
MSGGPSWLGGFAPQMQGQFGPLGAPIGGLPGIPPLGGLPGGVDLGLAPGGAAAPPDGRYWTREDEANKLVAYQNANADRGAR